MAAAGPSAAAAAGAAAAALLQQQLAADDAAGDGAPEDGWSEHQTGDGRKFYYHKGLETSTWEKPEELMTVEEQNNETNWREYKIWDGRVFYHNSETKVSCWSVPPELRKLRGESTGVDDRPLPQTQAEKRKVFWELMKDKGIDDSWSWSAVAEAMRDEPLALSISEAMRKQCFAELVGLHMRKKQLEAREKERSGASAFERLIEERFSHPELLATTYEEASTMLANEEAWAHITSDVRRDEVFQNVMERLEDKQRKTRTEIRPKQIVRLQRLMASDPELRRPRLRWRDVARLLSKKDELQEEDPPLESLRVWASLKQLRATAEHDNEAKSRSQALEATKAYREERKRRDALVAWLKDLALRGVVATDTPWEEFQRIAASDPKFVALQDSVGATAMELLDEFQQDLRRQGPQAVLGAVPGSAEAEAIIAARDGEEQARKRQRTGFDTAKKEEPDEDNTNALDALIAAPMPGGEDDDDDPFAEVVSRAQLQKNLA